MDAAPAAIPKKPKAPAMIAMIRKINVQRNIFVRFKVNNNTPSKANFMPRHTSPQLAMFQLFAAASGAAS
jgi:hypothetical protein